VKTYRYAIEIKASREKIWKILWDDATYPVWAASFHEGTHTVTDWQTGSRILFVDEKGNGAFAEIITNNPNETMVFRHQGWTGNFQPLPADMEFNVGGKIVKWSGGDETYRLFAHGDLTTLTVEMAGDFEEVEHHLNSTYPKALEKVRELSEQ